MYQRTCIGHTNTTQQIEQARTPHWQEFLIEQFNTLYSKVNIYNTLPRPLIQTKAVNLPVYLN